MAESRFLPDVCVTVPICNGMDKYIAVQIQDDDVGIDPVHGSIISETVVGIFIYVLSLTYNAHLF